MTTTTSQPAWSWYARSDNVAATSAKMAPANNAHLRTAARIAATGPGGPRRTGE